MERNPKLTFSSNNEQLFSMFNMFLSVDMLQHRADDVRSCIALQQKDKPKLFTRPHCGHRNFLGLRVMKILFDSVQS